MPQISNIGGSLTSAVVLTFLAWGVRLLRATAQRQGPSRKGSSSENGGTRPRFFASLTPAALRRLVGSTVYAAARWQHPTLRHPFAMMQPLTEPLQMVLAHHDVLAS